MPSTWIHGDFRELEHLINVGIMFLIGKEAFLTFNYGREKLAITICKSFLQSKHEESWIDVNDFVKWDERVCEAF